MKKLKPYILYSIIGGGVMLLAMLLGEYLYGPIFNGFLYKPILWIFALIETVVWVIPLTYSVLFFISKFPKIKGVRLIGLSFCLWVGLSLCVFLIYQIALGDPRLPIWNEAKISPSYIFGWYIPGVITIILFSILSPIVFEKH